MTTTCSICTEVGANVTAAGKCPSIVQRKKIRCLLAASLVGHMECVDILLEKGADVNCTDELFNWCCRGSLCCRAGLTRAPATWNPYIQENYWTPVM